MAVLTNDILFKPTESLDRVGNTKGDLLVRDTTEWEVVSAGAAGKVLTAHGAATLPTWETPSPGGLADGDYGDITVSGTGTVLTIDNDVVTYAKMQNVSAADKLLGRGNGGGAGDVQEITLGTNLSLTGTTLNAASGSSYTDEMAQDAVGAMIDASLTYVDGTPLLQRSALTGDVTASAGSNATTIANSAVTFAKIQNISTDTLIGRDTAGTGVATEINVGNGIQFTGGNAIGIAADGVDFTMLQNIATDTLLGRDSSGTGNVEEIELTAPLAFDGAGNIKISDDGITYALMQNISASKQVLGRNSSGAGDVQEVTLDQLLDWVSASVAQGDVLYRGSSSWARLAAGTSGLFLRTAGAGADPSWGYAGIDVQIFTSSNNWTKRAGTIMSDVIAIAPGGGGGSGRKGSEGGDRTGGGGGSAGQFVIQRIRTSGVSSPVSVTIGAKGTGGAGITANNTNGNPGTDGGDVTFGSYVIAKGGKGGAAGGTGTAAGGALRTNYNAFNSQNGVNGASGASTSGNASVPTAVVMIPAPGGGGGSRNASNIVRDGSNGGTINKTDGTTFLSGGSSGGTSGGQPGNSSVEHLIGSGGGGGMAATFSSIWYNGRNGGNGGDYGGGGGGGGAANDQTADFGNKGGDGGAGICIVISYIG